MGLFDAPATMAQTRELAAEIEPISSGYGNVGPLDWTSQSFSGGGATTNIIANFNFGKAVWIESVIIGANKPCIGQVSFGGSLLSGLGSMQQETIQVMLNPYQASTISIRMWHRTGWASTPGYSIRKIFDTDLTNLYFSYSVTGYQITDDLDFNASHRILIVGDSIMNGTGATSKDAWLPWLFRRYYTDKGIRARLINMSISGTTTIGHRTLLDKGRYDIDKLSMIIWMLGANDAAQGVTIQTFSDNLMQFINWKKARFPSAKMVILGSTPLENDTKEAALASLRSTAQSIVANSNDSSVKFISLAGSFNRKTTSFYASSDTTGDHVHLSDSGSLAAWNIIKPVLDSQITSL